MKEMESFEKNEIAFASSVKMRKQQCQKAFPLDVVESKKKQKLSASNSDMKTFFFVGLAMSLSFNSSSS